MGWLKRYTKGSHRKELVRLAKNAPALHQEK